MSSVRSTLDYAEIRSTFLLDTILRRWVWENICHNKVRLDRLDVESYGEGSANYVRCKGLLGFWSFPEIKIRFECSFLRPLLDNGAALSWGDRSDLLKGAIELKIDGSDCKGSIDTILCTRSDHNDFWELISLQTSETNEELHRRLREAVRL
jgi:hypothetical protein